MDPIEIFEARIQRERQVEIDKEIERRKEVIPEFHNTLTEFITELYARDFGGFFDVVRSTWRDQEYLITPLFTSGDWTHEGFPLFLLVNSEEAKIVYDGSSGFSNRWKTAFAGEDPRSAPHRETLRAHVYPMITEKGEISMGDRKADEDAKRVVGYGSQTDMLALNVKYMSSRLG